MGRRASIRKRWKSEEAPQMYNRDDMQLSALLRLCLDKFKEIFRSLIKLNLFYVQSVTTILECR